ncbi:hypothetical protein [Alteraurantiacibacter aquimixticola]|uniref:Uncharacterized protein n=1 Tax=Alteraurantiacibacter aquimixticola TaxID=2489173 RepID=A0A4T3EXV0_9SPHN|nr:hypothetical protein [Alteraurantiacibacter aquimixticola]TIX49478.1 hypothetical protein E5222_11545 [Alteraurantiacibacter aquimixticola]
MDSEGSACAAAADAEHERWIDLLSVGSAIERQSRSGGPGRITIEAGDAKSVEAINALAQCGGALQLALGDGRRTYRLSGVSIRQNEQRRNLRSEIRAHGSFTLTYEAVQRAD